MTHIVDIDLNVDLIISHICNTDTLSYRIITGYPTSLQSVNSLYIGQCYRVIYLFYWSEWCVFINLTDLYFTQGMRFWDGSNNQQLNISGELLCKHNSWSCIHCKILYWGDMEITTSRQAFSFLSREKMKAICCKPISYFII